MIHSDQTGYLKGRYIGENVIVSAGLMSFIKTFHVARYNKWARFTFFSICRAVRQGCSLSPYIFIICIELQAIRIRNYRSVKGVPIFKSGKTKEAKISLYTGDTILFLPGTECACYFSEIPNLLNFSKCEALKSDLSKIQMLCSSRTRI